MGVDVGRGQGIGAGWWKTGEMGKRENSKNKSLSLAKIIIITKWYKSKDKGEKKINSKQNKQKPGASQEARSLASTGLLLSC